MFNLLDVVRVRNLFSESCIKNGDIGTITEIFNNHKKTAYEVEFCDNQGKTIEILTLTADNLIKGSS